jgi:hypothetical protein
MGFTPSFWKVERKMWHIQREAWRCPIRSQHYSVLSFPALVLISLLFPSVPRSLAQTDQDLADPSLLSIFPLGGRRGTTLQGEIWGNSLEGSYGVWCGTGGLSGKLLTVEEMKGQTKEDLLLRKKPEKPLPLYRARIEVEIQPTALLGIHFLRLIGPRGISDAVPFRVMDGMVVQETASPHQTINEALAVSLPVVINGRLEKPGELDYYSFDAKQNQELTFEVILAQNCDPQLALYRVGGSWFDPDRSSRLIKEEQKSSDLMSPQSRRTYRFSHDGKYFLEISPLFGRASSGSTYQVRVALSNQAAGDAQLKQHLGEWEERNFSRKLEESWLKKLEAREVSESDGSPPGMREPSMQTDTDNARSEPKSKPMPNLRAPLSSVVEREPNDQASEAQDLPIPSIVEGTIERASDIDSFKVKVEAGQKLAFEIETLDAKRPYFNPRLGVVDSQDRELFSNVERRLSLFNNNSEPQVYLKGIEPKVVYTFEYGGEYTVQIRDITSRYGNASYRYRILVRPQIPHVGEVSILEGDRINLTRGKPKKLTIISSYEEGFRGELSFAFSGLPAGVQTFPASQFEEGKAPREVTQNADVISPKQQRTTLVLLAKSEDSKPTNEPTMIQLHCRPIVKGKLGPDLLVRELPMMVLEDIAQK